MFEAFLCGIIGALAFNSITKNSKKNKEQSTRQKTKQQQKRNMIQKRTDEMIATIILPVINSKK